LLKGIPMGAGQMKWSLDGPGREPAFRLHFHALVPHGEDLTFPCDAHGHVDIDSLGEKARANYFFARNAVGREYSPPSVEPNE
jgi:hypothetical protein